ncbi:uncharacterized protein LOC115324801 [Ixodes scapularis]|uniref:uncharacterized protein LOC115324801 n=1 Tax=Ixodes scapularis TaxID=6945 RepID=UPI001A9DEB54|nr:uncharacterized protein LOC115324801 [Ixodes scapularis]
MPADPRLGELFPSMVPRVLTRPHIISTAKTPGTKGQVTTKAVRLPNIKQHGEMLNKLCAILPVHAVIAHPSLVEQALNTLPDLLAFEKELDEEKAPRLVTHELKQLGGKTASKATKRMLTHLLTDELAAQFSWIGRKGKLNFSVLKTAAATTDAANMLPGGKDAIEDTIKSWLRHAPQRAKGQRCKAPQADQTEGTLFMHV